MFDCKLSSLKTKTNDINLIFKGQIKLFLKHQTYSRGSVLVILVFIE